MRVGLLTGGGDCPGLNAVIRAVVRSGLAAAENSFLGFRHGWAGVLEDDAFELDLASTAGILPRGDAILVPERPFDIDEVVAHLRQRHARGRSFSIVVVAEGASPRQGALQTLSDVPTDAFGHARLGGIGVTLEKELEARTGFEARVTILGHVQRGGTPVAFDRVLATRFGVAAMDAAASGRFGAMVALRGTAIVEVALGQALAESKLLDPALYETAELFFG